MSHNRVVSIDSSADYARTESYPGFSERLNQLIDHTTLKAPPLDDGRQAFLARSLGISKVAAASWLKKDQPPNTGHLRKMVSFLLNYIDIEVSPFRVEAWLKYGSEVSDPFADQDLENQALIPLAVTVILSEARKISVSGTDFDLQAVLSVTTGMFAEFGVRDESTVESVHRKIVSQYIKANLI